MEHKDRLVRDSFVLFIATCVVNLSNFVFHSLASRWIGPEKYGGLVTLLALIVIVAMPAQALQMTITKKTSVFKAREKPGAVEALFKKTTLWFFVLGLCYFLFFAVAAVPIGKFFRIYDRGLMYILGAIALVAVMLPVVRGIQQGLQKFVSLGINMSSDALSRLLFLVILVFLLKWDMRGALLTTLAGGLTAYLAGMVDLRTIFDRGDTRTEIIRKKELFSYAIPVFFSMLGFSLLCYMDVFMVKHFFDEHNAGLYSATSMIGKAFLYFPSAIVMTLFPKVSENLELNKGTKILLIKSLVLTAGISLFGVIFCFIFPELIVGIMFGQKFMSITGIVRIFGMAIMPLVLFNVVMNYSLALHRYFFIYAMYAGIVLYAALLWFFHASFMQVVCILFGVNLLILAASVISLRLPGHGAQKHAV
ncbi:MAG: oligosaccharide flippase family protein [Spirochaetia bacterium]|nr:oligosaccharide flippase family protein [Spirochaetia bacterium]